MIGHRSCLPVHPLLGLTIPQLRRAGCAACLRRLCQNFDVTVQGKAVSLDVAREAFSFENMDSRLDGLILNARLATQRNERAQATTARENACVQSNGWQNTSRLTVRTLGQGIDTGTAAAVKRDLREKLV